MSVGWIDNIYNNSDDKWYLKSVDDRHNGALQGGDDKFVLDDGEFHEIKAKTHYVADWCGIPWYAAGKHFKLLSKDQATGSLFYTSELEGRNWVVYLQIGTGRKIARQVVPKGSDFHCNLRFEAEGVFLDVVNNNAFSGESAFYQIYNEAKVWVQALAPIVAAAVAKGEPHKET